MIDSPPTQRKDACGFTSMWTAVKVMAARDTIGGVPKASWLISPAQMCQGFDRGGHALYQKQEQAVSKSCEQPPNERERTKMKQALTISVLSVYHYQNGVKTEGLENASPRRKRRGDGH